VVDLPLQTLPNIRIHGVGMNRDMGSTSASQFGVPPLFSSSFPLASGSGMNPAPQASTSASNWQAPTPNYRPGSVLPQYAQSPYFSAHSLYIDYLRDRGNYAGSPEWAEGERNAAE